MQIGSICAAALVAAGLAGCMGTANVAMPEQKPTTAGIFSAAPAKSDLTRVKGGPGSKLGVVLSANTMANTDYIRARYNADKDSDSPVIQSYLLTVDMKFPMGWIANTLRRDFGSVVLLSDMNDTRQGSMTAYAILDVYYEPKGSFNGGQTTRLKLAFYDSSKRYVGTASTQSRREDPAFVNPNSETAWNVNNMRTNHRVLVSTLQSFDTEIAKLVDIPPSGSVSQAGSRAASGPGTEDAGRDSCIATAMKVANTNLRRQAMAACE